MLTIPAAYLDADGADKAWIIRLVDRTTDTELAFSPGDLRRLWHTLGQWLDTYEHPKEGAPHGEEMTP